MRFFSKKRLVLIAFTFLGLFFVHAPLILYTVLSSDKQFLPETREEIEVFRYVLLLLSGGAFGAAFVWHKSQNSTWSAAIMCDYSTYCEHVPLFDPLVRQRLFVAMWSGVMLLVFVGLYATIQLSFTYQGKGVRWYDMLALEDGVWEMITALGLLGAGLVLIWGTLKYQKGRSNWSLCLPLALGFLLCFASGEEISWGQRWLRCATPETIKNLNVQGEFTLHNMGGRWANQIMILFFLGYVGFAPMLGAAFVDIRYLYERLNIPCAPLWFTPWAFLGILFDERDLFSHLWGSPPWCLDEVRETLFGVIMLGIMVHTVIYWQIKYKMKKLNF